VSQQNKKSSWQLKKTPQQIKELHGKLKNSTRQIKELHGKLKNSTANQNVPRQNKKLCGKFIFVDLAHYNKGKKITRILLD